jgi:alpha-glucosidase (family GH31 glycosyl hydrolase)
MDAGVAARVGTNYTALDEGTKADVWIKRADKSGPLTAGVWCGNAYFPDFFKPATTDYWK